MAQNTYVPASPASSGAAFSDLQAGGLVGVLNKFITANATVTPPASQATVAPTGGGASGGNLPAGVYYASYTYLDGFGETTIGSSRSASFTVAAGNIPTLTFNDTVPTGAVARNIYLTLAGGAAGTETKYAIGIAKATTTFNLSFAGPVQTAGPADAIPAANTTGAAEVQPMLDALFTKNQAWLVVDKARTLVNNYVHGDPVSFYQYMLEVQRFDNIFASYRQVMADILGLMAANPGSLHNSSTNVMPYVKRTFP